MSDSTNKFSIDINHVPLEWKLVEGVSKFFDIPGATFWINPSLRSILAPIVDELGIPLYRLLIASSSSQGSKEDYQNMVKSFGNNFKDGFNTWCNAVAVAGWGKFELEEYDKDKAHAIVKVTNAWELIMQKDVQNRWGCPFIQGKLIGIFNLAFNTNCWADEIETHYDLDNPVVKFKIYSSEKTTHKELDSLRDRRFKKREKILRLLIDERTYELQKAKKELQLYSEDLENRVKERTKELEDFNAFLQEKNEEIKSQQEQFKELNSTKDKFFSIIAHDLKNPFNTIMGFSELLLDNFDELSKSEKLNYTRIIHSSTQNLVNFSDNLLSWARSNTGDLKFKPKEISLNEIVSDVLSYTQIQADKKNITIHKTCDSSIDKIFADPNMLSVIIRNLLSNAIKYSHKNTEVSLSSKKHNNQITITVKDSGVGMSEKTIHDLFKLTTKVQQEGTEAEQGTGLGLILCKEFISKHNGEIRVKSELGKGSEFSFTIPVH